MLLLPPPPAIDCRRMAGLLVPEVSTDPSRDEVIASPLPPSPFGRRPDNPRSTEKLGESSLVSKPDLRLTAWPLVPPPPPIDCISTPGDCAPRVLTSRAVLAVMLPPLPPVPPLPPMLIEAPMLPRALLREAPPSPPPPPIDCARSPGEPTPLLVTEALRGLSLLPQVIVPALPPRPPLPLVVNCNPS